VSALGQRSEGYLFCPAARFAVRMAQNGFA